jgi:hypothetical protein
MGTVIFLPSILALIFGLNSSTPYSEKMSTIGAVGIVIGLIIVYLGMEKK